MTTAAAQAGFVITDEEDLEPLFLECAEQDHLWLTPVDPIERELSTLSC